MIDAARAHPGFLSPYKVLDISDERGLLAGWMLARLGADVVQLETTEGSAARRVEPFHRGPTKDSAFWAAYATGRRSVVCAFDQPDDQRFIEQLVARADIFIESSGARTARQLGLDYDRLREINPKLIYVSISAFGANGPKADYAASDLIIWAASGALWPSRDNHGVPLRISVPQAYLHAAADAASGALLAIFARHASGQGQFVEVSAQQSTAIASLSTTLAHAVGHAHFQFSAEGPRPRKQIDMSGSGARTRRSKWPVADGLLEMHLGMGPASGGSVNKLFAWMREENALPDEFSHWDWIKLPAQIVAGEIDDAQIDRAREAVAEFVKPKRKQALLDEALRRGVLMAPAMTIGDLVDSTHHRARAFYESVGIGERQVTVPAMFANGCEQGFVRTRLAPILGEHTDAVRAEWLS